MSDWKCHGKLRRRFSSILREWKDLSLAFVSRASFYRWVRLSPIARVEVQPSCVLQWVPVGGGKPSLPAFAGGNIFMDYQRLRRTSCVRQRLSRQGLLKVTSVDSNSYACWMWRLEASTTRVSSSLARRPSASILSPCTLFQVWHPTAFCIGQPILNIHCCTQVAYGAAYASFKRVILLLARYSCFGYRPGRRTHISLPLYFSEMMIRLGSKFAASVLVVTLDFAYTASVRPLAFLCHLRRTIALK